MWNVVDRLPWWQVRAYMEDPQVSAYAQELLATWDEMDTAVPARRSRKQAAVSADSWVSEGGVVVKGNRG